MLTCDQCKDGFLPLSDLEGKKCVLSPSNCEVLNSLNTCKKCKEGFGLVNGKCETG